MSENTDSTNNFKRYIDDFFEGLELYDDYGGRHHYKDILKAGIDVFLDHESDYTAKEIYRTFFMIYQITDEDKSQRQEDMTVISEQNTLLGLVEVMEKYEKNTGELIDRQRDHFIHSVNVFLLGLAIYSQNKKFRSIFKKYITDSKYEKYYGHDVGKVSREEFFYRWGVASLLHDIGYPFEIVGKQLKKIINDGVKSISNSYDVDIGINYSDFNQFNSIIKMDPFDFADNYREEYKQTKMLDLFKPTDIMAHKISLDFGFDDEKFLQVTNHLNAFVDYMRENDFIDHGFYSAILVLNSYGKIFQKYKKDKVFFFYPVVDSATAILLHNYYNKTLQKDPFNLKLLSPYKNPIAFLLILCDELQEWNRQPFGQIDKKKLHVNELEISIDKELLRVKYILKNGYLGLGFSKDKKSFIDSVLDVHSIFDMGLVVSSDVEPGIQEEIMRNRDIEDIQAPDVLMRNIEEIAIEINRLYNVSIEEEYNEKLEKGLPIDENLQKSYDYMCDFNDLDSEFKLSNLRQARSIPKKLNMIGCEIASIDADNRRALTKDDFDEKEIEDLAKFEHLEWCEEKIGTGWTYGEVKDRTKRETPYLVEYDKLDERTKQLDRNAILIIPELLEHLGLKVVRSKIRLLTFKMQEFFDNEELNPNSTGEDEFNKLNNHIKYANFKQANFLVKILNEKGYDLVSVDEAGKPVNHFDEDEINYFAEREHYGWCKLKYDLGWKFGSGEDMTSPNLVKWDDLDESVKQMNKKTFENLPFICKDPNVGLKIIKSE